MPGLGLSPHQELEAPAAGPSPGTPQDQQESWEHGDNTTPQTPLALPGSGHASKGVDAQCLHLPPPQGLG